jgi:alpha-beta hydrolase superfamily lysophospholipase
VSTDLPGHGQARGERGDRRFPMWLHDIDTAATGMRERWQRPVYVLGSSQGSAAA